MKEEQFNKLKVGNIIWNISYFGGYRHVEANEIIEVFDKSFRMKRLVVVGFGNHVGEIFNYKKEWMLNKLDKFHLSLESAKSYVIDHNIKAIKELRLDLKRIPKTILIIKRELKDLEKANYVLGKEGVK